MDHGTELSPVQSSISTGTQSNGSIKSPSWNRGTKRYRRTDPDRKSRGRPSEWTASRRRRHLRLYLCTDIPHIKILGLIAENGFQPKERRAQQQLKRMLGESYAKARPTDRAQMKARVTFLRSLRRRSSTLRTARRASTVGSQHNVTSVQRSPEISARALSMTTDIEVRFSEESTVCSASSRQGDEARGEKSLSENLTHSTENGSCIPPPATTSSSDEDIRRQERLSLVRKLVPGKRTSSFIADAASLLGGLSMRSSFHPSLTSSSISSWRFSGQHPAPFVERPRKGRWYNLFSKRAEANEAENTSSRKRVDDPENIYATTIAECEAHSDNFILLLGCCRLDTFDPAPKTPQLPRCIHRQLGEAVWEGIKTKQDLEASGIRVDETNANIQDAAGNILLHFAARWGASIPILLEIMEHTYDLSSVNARQETFMHLVDLKDDSCLKSLIHCLLRRGFVFHHADASNRSFVHCMLQKRCLSWNALLLMFEAVPTETLQVWVMQEPLVGQMLMDLLQGKQI